MTAARRRYSPTVDSADPDRDSDLPLAHAKGVPQSQNFANLPHRRSLGGHRTSPCMAAKGASSAIRSPTSRTSGRAHHGGRLQTEWVADFRRNRWPDCVGITGRFASDYACALPRNMFRGNWSSRITSARAPSALSSHAASSPRAAASCSARNLVLIVRSKPSSFPNHRSGPASRQKDTTSADVTSLIVLSRDRFSTTKTPPTAVAQVFHRFFIVDNEERC